MLVLSFVMALIIHHLSHIGISIPQHLDSFVLPFACRCEPGNGVNAGHRIGDICYLEI